MGVAYVHFTAMLIYPAVFWRLVRLHEEWPLLRRNMSKELLSNALWIAMMTGIGGSLVVSAGSLLSLSFHYLMSPSPYLNWIASLAVLFVSFKYLQDLSEVFQFVSIATNSRNESTQQ
jgi:hypothetical protein